MSSSVSRSKPDVKFILDENVKRRLCGFLESLRFDAKIAPKGVANGMLAALSKSEKRVLVTNDSDFADPVLFPREKVFSVVLLKIPQDEPEALLNAFKKLLKEKARSKDFEGYAVILNEETFEVSELPSASVRH